MVIFLPQPAFAGVVTRVQAEEHHLGVRPGRLHGGRVQAHDELNQGPPQVQPGGESDKLPDCLPVPNPGGDLLDILRGQQPAVRQAEGGQGALVHGSAWH